MLCPASFLFVWCWLVIFRSYVFSFITYLCSFIFFPILCGVVVVVISSFLILCGGVVTYFGISYLFSYVYFFPIFCAGVCYLFLISFYAFLVFSILCGLRISYLCLGSRKWFSVSRKLSLKTTIACGRWIWCLGFHKTMHPIECF